MIRTTITRNKKNFPKIGFSVALASIFLIVLFQHPLQRVVFSLFESISFTRETPYALIPQKTLALRLEKAEKELSRIRFQSVLYEQATLENAKLKEFIGTLDSESNTIGIVVATPPQTHYDSLVISVPTSGVIQENDRVVFSNILLGSVSDVSGRIVKANLFSAPGNTVDARVGEPNAIVVLNGEGGGAFSFEIPQDVAIASGDIIFSTGGEYIIAIVSSEKATPDSTSKKVFAHTPISFFELQFVEFVHSVEY
ncbi:hypothetical protein COU15_01075 [Candidatus Kaiserbacteria bacterium CG10_big_fil_rev_8_21_14_0_10_45_20]|uniref:Rod shape-determining protein MreC beta-barrel core domain-containing protein n=1 Tax=Candidatus Kaiserbacteria bacterium CG10_big_fil_rev_8_21_14_0_10_45_20 TaxID=1974607 RepID=A0A2H0UG54_9BACT|nr:MAG: hypothetical protein COU15_01075 [Candidatus Kaiserbacteria bacterium CG10_big_fil_rev_8_21_14_0_10_45_20]